MSEEEKRAADWFQVGRTSVRDILKNEGPNRVLQRSFQRVNRWLNRRSLNFSRVLFIVHGTSDTTSTNVSSTYLDQVKIAINEALTTALGKVRTSHAKRRDSITRCRPVGLRSPRALHGIFNDTVYCSIMPDVALQYVSGRSGRGSAASRTRRLRRRNSSAISNTTRRRIAWRSRFARLRGRMRRARLFRLNTRSRPLNSRRAATSAVARASSRRSRSRGGRSWFSSYIDRDVLAVHVAAWTDYLRVLSRNSEQVIGARLPLRARRQTTRSPLRNIRWPLTWGNLLLSSHPISRVVGLDGGFSVFVDAPGMPCDSERRKSIAAACAARGRLRAFVVHAGQDSSWRLRGAV